MKNKRLIMFYSDNCESCGVMIPLIEKLEQEHSIKVARLEVWHNGENKQLLEEYAGVGMVPFFYNETTGAKISGEANYEDLKKWASLDSSPIELASGKND